MLVEAEGDYHSLKHTPQLLAPLVKLCKEFLKYIIFNKPESQYEI